MTYLFSPSISSSHSSSSWLLSDDLDLVFVLDDDAAVLLRATRLVMSLEFEVLARTPERGVKTLLVTLEDVGGILALDCIDNRFTEIKLFYNYMYYQ